MEVSLQSLVGEKHERQSQELKSLKEAVMRKKTGQGVAAVNLPSLS